MGRGGNGFEEAALLAALEYVQLQADVVVVGLLRAPGRIGGSEQLVDVVAQPALGGLVQEGKVPRHARHVLAGEVREGELIDGLSQHLDHGPGP